MSAQNLRLGPGSRECGFALLLLLALLGLAALFTVIGRLNGAVVQRASNPSDSAALGAAREALIGYAAIYRDTHSTVPPPIFGYLPCPATDGSGVAASTCGTAGAAVIGFLPFKTLNLPDLRDSSGVCLWYAVSGRIKNSPPQLQLNWDVQGQFTVHDIAGATLVEPNTQDGGPVAVLIAPGAVLAGQSRSAANTPCGKAPTYADFVDGNPVFPNASSVTLINGTPTSLSSNDQIAWITAKDVFDRIDQRTDFAVQINGLIAEMASCLANGLPTPAPPAQTVVGNEFGMVPNIPTSGSASYCPTGSVNSDNIQLWRNWRELFRYMRCTGGGACANGASCKGILLFGGQRAVGQARASNADKADAANYLEGTNATNWTAGGVTYFGSLSYVQTSPAQDVVICLN